jgi:hypothetical protein
MQGTQRSHAGGAGVSRRTQRSSGVLARLFSSRISVTSLYSTESPPSPTRPTGSFPRQDARIAKKAFYRERGRFCLLCDLCVLCESPLVPLQTARPASRRARQVRKEGFQGLRLFLAVLGDLCVFARVRLPRLGRQALSFAKSPRSPRRLSVRRGREGCQAYSGPDAPERS